MNKKAVLVLDGSQRSALAVTRSIGRRQIPVITASESPSAICQHSRYSTSHVIYPDPKYNPEQFLVWLKGFLSANQIDMVFPVTDITCNILAPLAPRYKNTHIPLASIESINSLSDKSRLTQLASKLSLPHPQSIYVQAIDQVERIRPGIRYPCVIKPSFSRYFMNNQWNDTRVSIVQNQKDFDSLFAKHKYLQQQPFMIQEYIQGTGQGVFSLYSSGREIAWFAHRRLREKPPWGGVSVLSESVKLPEDMVEISRKILDHVSWHGAAMVEFKVAENGTPYIIEVNTRFWGSLQLAVDAGVDFPYLMYKLAVNKEIHEVSEYKVGSKLRWYLGDLDSLLITFKSKEFNFQKKIARFARFFIPDLINTKHEIFRYSDIKPAIFELKKYIADIIGKK